MEYQYRLTPKERRIEELKERMKALEAARDAEIDAADETIEDYDLFCAAQREINARYDPQIERVIQETRAAHMVKPRNKWFLEAMKGFCDKCLASEYLCRGLKQYGCRLSRRQVETFGRYITTLTRRDGMEHGCEVDGFVIELTTHKDCGYLTVTCYR